MEFLGGEFLRSSCLPQALLVRDGTGEAQGQGLCCISPHAMKTISQLRSEVTQVASAFLLLTVLTSCELPPREAWRIIQRDGLITYWSRDYHPALAPSRYLVPNGSPLQPARQMAYVPYRPESARNRYLTEQPRVYRPRPQVERESRRDPGRKEAVVTSPPKIPLESSTVKPQPQAPEAPAKMSMETLPYGTPVEGRPGMVTSPFAGKQQLVDVTGMAPGEAVKDPYSGKLFRVPPTQQAMAPRTAPEAAPTPTEPLTEAKDEAKPKP